MSKKRQTTKTTASKRAQYKQDKARRSRLFNVFFSLGIAVFALSAFLLLRPKEVSLPREISAAEAYEKVQQGAYLLDVRTQQEWEASHIAGSTLIPLNELKNRLDELPRDQELVVICRSGNRSNAAIKILAEAGFTDIKGVKGGLRAWGQAGYPYEGELP